MRLVRGGISLVLCAVLLAGCTTSETDARKLSTGDLLFGNRRLQEHLAARRAELQVLQQRVVALDEQLLFRLGSLQRLRRELSEAGSRTAQSDAERQELLREVEHRRAEAEAARQRVLGAQQDIERQVSRLDDEAARRRVMAAAGETERRRIFAEELNRQNAARTQAALEEQAATRKSVEQIEADCQTLDRAIERTVSLRAEQLLRAEPGLR